MTTGLKILGVVGARSGSVGLPHKNIKLLLGKPLLAWIIEAAKASKYITRVVLSTDSEEYAAIGRQFGAETPFMRPRELAENHVPDFDWLHHAAVWLRDNENWQADIIVRLPPTSPLCTTEDIDACIKLLLLDPNADSAYTVLEATKHPYKMWRTQNNGEYIEPFLSEDFTGIKDAYNKPRQSYPKAYMYIDSSAIRWRTLVDRRSMAGEKVRYRIISEAVDIDTAEDFKRAEKILRARDSAPATVHFFTPESEGPEHWKNILVAHVPSLFTGKVLVRSAGHRGGLQYHRVKNEAQYLFSGTMLVEYDTGDGVLSQKTIQAGEAWHIPPGAVHRETALTDSVIFEVSNPVFNDRVRVEETYGIEPDPNPAPTTSFDDIVEK